MNDKIIKRMAEFLGEHLSTCPADTFNYLINGDCEEVCGEFGRDVSGDCFQCWIDYFNDDNNFKEE